MAKKRLLSLLLVCSMFFGMLQGTALAAEEISSFQDVKTSDWFYDAVQFVQDHDLMSGVGNGKFAPDDAAARGMLVTILYNLEGRPAAGTPDFTDVPANEWYAAPVAWASAKGVVSGYGNGKFGPDDPVTREQMATMLYQYAQYKQYDLTAFESFFCINDGEKVSAYARTPILWALRNGLLSLDDNYSLNPHDFAKCSHVAAVMKSFYEKVMTDLGEQTLYQIDPSEVISIRLENWNKMTQVEITERDEMEKIVNLVNGFTYIATRKYPPLSGESYYLCINTKSGGNLIDFMSDHIDEPDDNGEFGSSICYYGKPGYFDSLEKLADAATDPMMM